MDEPYQAEPVDVWGMGVILFTLLAGSTYDHRVRPVNESLRHLQPDTPWDEPTKRSPEFRRYLSGEFVIDAPWNRIDRTALCEPTRYILLIDYGLRSQESAYLRDAISRSSGTHGH